MSAAKGHGAIVFVFIRFHAKPGEEAKLMAALEGVVVPSRAEEGCVEIQAYRSVTDGSLFFIHSRWKDQAALDFHYGLPHTMHFLKTMTPLVDHEIVVERTQSLAIGA